ncbi:hypothetical protein BDR26DRAFT_862276 [Obelidium mucronatum]|nr:hypothetical protein BDR26DRAFT_862276 [Obelidium mucronatum]
MKFRRGKHRPPVAGAPERRAGDAAVLNISNFMVASKSPATASPDMHSSPGSPPATRSPFANLSGPLSMSRQGAPKTALPVSLPSSSTIGLLSAPHVDLGSGVQVLPGTPGSLIRWGDHERNDDANESYNSTTPVVFPTSPQRPENGVLSYFSINRRSRTSDALSPPNLPRDLTHPSEPDYSTSRKRGGDDDVIDLGYLSLERARKSLERRSVLATHQTPTNLDMKPPISEDSFFDPASSSSIPSPPSQQRQSIPVPHERGSIELSRMERRLLPTSSIEANINSRSLDRNVQLQKIRLHQQSQQQPPPPQSAEVITSANSLEIDDTPRPFKSLDRKVARPSVNSNMSGASAPLAAAPTNGRNMPSKPLLDFSIDHTVVSEPSRQINRKPSAREAHVSDDHTAPSQSPPPSSFYSQQSSTPLVQLTAKPSIRKEKPQPLQTQQQQQQPQQHQQHQQQQLSASSLSRYNIGSAPGTAPLMSPPKHSLMDRFTSSIGGGSGGGASPNTSPLGNILPLAYNTMGTTATTTTTTTTATTTTSNNNNINNSSSHKSATPSNNTQLNFEDRIDAAGSPGLLQPGLSVGSGGGAGGAGGAVGRRNSAAHHQQQKQKQQQQQQYHQVSPSQIQQQQHMQQLSSPPPPAGAPPQVPLPPPPQPPQPPQTSMMPRPEEIRTVPQTSNEAIEFALMQLRMKEIAAKQKRKKAAGLIEEEETEGDSESEETDGEEEDESEDEEDDDKEAAVVTRRGV